MVSLPLSISACSLADKIRCVDKAGLLLQSMDKSLTHAQIIYARSDQESNPQDPASLQSIIAHVKPHVLVGTSTKPKTFTKEVVQEMASHVARPIILPLSNPTRLHEADPQDLTTWTSGAALIATGSPFPPVSFTDSKGNKKTYEVAECNNSTVFPGLGCVLSRARLLSDKMLVAACETLAAQAPALKDPDAALLPDVVDVRNISVKIASAVVRTAVEEGLAQVEGIPDRDEDREEWVRAQMWDARYQPLKKVASMR